jgi:hypothetical protein
LQFLGFVIVLLQCFRAGWYGVAGLSTKSGDGNQNEGEAGATEIESNEHGEAGKSMGYPPPISHRTTVLEPAGISDYRFRVRLNLGLRDVSPSPVKIMQSLRRRDFRSGLAIGGMTYKGKESRLLRARFVKPATLPGIGSGFVSL